MVQAVAIAAHQNPKIHAVFVGDGELREQAEHMAAQLDCASNISFVGFRSDIPEVLSATDAYVLPSLWEGLPIGVIEAMAMAKAIVASNIEANAEVIEHGVTGLLVPVSDPKTLAAEMVQLSGDAKLVQELGEHAYEKAFDQLQLDDMTLRVEDVYRRNVSSTRTFKRLVRRTTYKMPD